MNPSSHDTDCCPNYIYHHKRRKLHVSIYCSKNIKPIDAPKLSATPCMRKHSCINERTYVHLREWSSQRRANPKLLSVISPFTEIRPFRFLSFRFVSFRRQHESFVEQRLHEELQRGAVSRRSESRLIASNHLQERSPASACTRRLVTVYTCISSSWLPRLVAAQACTRVCVTRTCLWDDAGARIHASYEGFAIAWEEIAAKLRCRSELPVSFSLPSASFRVSFETF